MKKRYLSVEKRLFRPESFERFIGGDSAPRPPLPPLPLVSWTATHRKTEKERQLADGREDEGGGAESFDRKKAWPSINHSILSDLDYLVQGEHHPSLF